MDQPPPILEVHALRKEFPGVTALKAISLAFQPGEVHALVGENGAGKSTLMKILAGVYQPTAGRIILRGNDVRWRSVAQAQRHGIVMIHQELNLVDELSVADNIFLGREDTAHGLIRVGRQRLDALAVLGRLNARLAPAERVKNLSVAEKQLVEIAKALSFNASVLIMDEPTAVLTHHETEALFNLIAQLRRDGVTVLYISHILPEVLRVCQRITVLRDGEVVRTLSPNEVQAASETQLASMMVGRPMADHFPPRTPATPKVLLSVRGLCSGTRVRDVSLNVCCGEILGLAGLVGAGRTELGETIAGLRRCDGGIIEMEGAPLHIRRPWDAVNAGIAYLSEDRKERGLTLPMSTTENTVVAMGTRAMTMPDSDALVSPTPMVSQTKYSTGSISATSSSIFS
jgi:ribose transport system ATP-binding protein